jgi:hypothetical protein
LKAATCGGPHLEGIFQNEWRFDWTEARLFAIEFPEIAEVWARRGIEESPSAIHLEHLNALNTLCLLSRHRFGGAESVLLGLLKEGDRFVRWGATFPLCIRKEHRLLRRQLAREGNYLAIEALSYWPDRETMDFCQESHLKELGIDGNYSAAWSAKHVRSRLEALASQDWEDQVRQMIGEWEHFEWALWIARERQVPWLEKALRARVENLLKSERVSLALPPSMAIDPGYRILDQALLVLAELGSPLEEKERAYLTHYGYACDSRKRLTSLLEEKQYPP